ncbi:MAG TPA: FemAB family XrtA/PEP-CTERM system-associated protein [Methylomirabilota bacterium]|nr:FemAB family XrtA/PEP-CTERM system-associated protein [Methylomirabilota bacterium]
MDIRTLATETVDWDAFVRSTTGGSPFHLIAWKRAVESTFRHRAHYLMAVRGGGLEGVLPLFEVRGLLGGLGLVSVPYGVYGGICARTTGARAALVEAARDLGRRIGAGYVELRHRSGQELELPTKRLYVTFSRPLSASDDENLNAIPRKQRRMTRQGVKHGLRAEIGSQHLDTFWNVYAHSVHSLGSPVFPRRLFHALAHEFGKECELLTVWKEQRMVAGVVSLYYEDQVLPYYGGALREALPYAVNDFMYWELMCHASRAGRRVFDFGRSREGTGAFAFKRHWGFEPVPLPYQYILSDGHEMPNMSPSNPKMHLAVETWKRLPLPLTKVLGPRLTRYLP